MSATDRIASEQLFHDRQARLRAAYFDSRPHELQFSDDSYLDHESWIRPAMDQLGDVAGRRVLDFGCGHGMAAVVLARRGARVTAFDLSSGYTAEAAARARANRVDVEFVQANGERLPFVDQTFDRIWGNAILHHLDINQAGRELHRVLQRGGSAVFCEPWGGNPLLNWSRRAILPSGKSHTPDERPLHRQDLAILRTIFRKVEARGFQLFSMLGRSRRNGQLKTALHRLDEFIFNRLPPLQHLCRYQIVTLHK